MKNNVYLYVINSYNNGIDIMSTSIAWSMTLTLTNLQLKKVTFARSLVDLPRWGLATADDHSDIFLLHCARSCDISFSWRYSQPVHSSMLCIHCLLGLPWCRSPSVIPSRTVSANCPALPRVMWPKYCSFSFATLPINSLSRPNSVNIESFVLKGS